MIGLHVPGSREGAFAFLDALQVFKLAVSLDRRKASPSTLPA